MKLLSATLLLAAATATNGHTIFQQIGINGVMQTRYNFMRLPEYNGPITDVTSTDLICNGGPNPIKRISTNVASLTAGSTVTLQWAHMLETDPATGLIIDGSHKGPVTVYMAKVSSATGAAPTSGWFKFYEYGLTGRSDTGTWGVDKLIANKGKLTVTIPSCLPVGDYLLQGELIALHGAGSNPGAQLYMECAQIRITSGGSASPQTYNIPGIYSPASVTTNIYWPVLESYTIPGPRPFKC